MTQSWCVELQWWICGGRIRVRTKQSAWQEYLGDYSNSVFYKYDNLIVFWKRMKKVKSKSRKLKIIPAGDINSPFPVYLQIRLPMPCLLYGLWNFGSAIVVWLKIQTVVYWGFEMLKISTNRTVDLLKSELEIQLWTRGTMAFSFFERIYRKKIIVTSRKWRLKKR
jgi:hypothetical protein